MRLVSLCPSTTELLFQLGVGDQLVGITDWCIHPADEIAGIEKIGGTKTPNVQRIGELRPDLVFLNEEENRKEDGEALAALDISLHTSFPKTVDQSIELIRSVGAAVGATARSYDLADRAELERDRVARLAAGAKPVRFAYLIWRKPWMVAAGDTYLTDLLGLAGGVNAFAGHAERYPALTAEELIEPDPDVFLLCSEPFPFQERHCKELESIEGFEAKEFRLADGEALTWHGSRTLSGITYAWDLLEGVRAAQDSSRA